jgi:hypothetical protein
MPNAVTTFTPPPKLKAAFDEANGLAAAGREIVEAFDQGSAIDPHQVVELTAALRAGNARFKEEWAACQTELPDGRKVFTPDFEAVVTLLGNPSHVHLHIKKIDAQGRVVKLDLSSESISDLGAISGLTALQWLGLNNNMIQDLNPLSGLNALRDLSLQCNQIEDLTPLAGLAGLKRLNLAGNQISDPGPLSQLTRLRRLDFGDNELQNIAPLATLTELRELHLEDNLISDIGPLSSLRSLRRLNIEFNRLRDLRPLSGLAALQTLDLYACTTQAINLDWLRNIPLLGSVLVGRKTYGAIIQELRTRGVEVR